LFGGEARATGGGGGGGGGGDGGDDGDGMCARKTKHTLT